MTRFVGLPDGEQGAFGVGFPDCPGCTAMGGTAEEALRTRRRPWSRGAGRPPRRSRRDLPRSVDQIRADPDVQAEIADSVLVSVPLLLDAGRIVQTDVALDAGLLAEIDAAARRRGVSRSAFIASAAREKILATG